MAQGLIDLILDLIMDENWLGRRGETLTARKLKLLRLLGRKGQILRNVYLPKEDGGTSEIDVLFITQNGIFVFESKNYSGWIFGDERAQYWTAMLQNRQKNRFYSPIRQNRTHIKWLRTFLNTDIPLYSVIVFSERCELKKVQVYSSDVHVVKRDQLSPLIRRIWDTAPDVLTEDDIERFYRQLQPLTNADEATKQAHIESIQRRFPKDSPHSALEAPHTTPEPSCTEAPQNAAVPAPEPAPTPAPSQSPVCPRCGSKLILRTAKKGANAGRQFYGCSRFPSCRYIAPIR